MLIAGARMYLPNEAGWLTSATDTWDCHPRALHRHLRFIKCHSWKRIALI